MVGKMGSCDHGDACPDGIQKAIFFVYHYRDHIKACVRNNNGEQNTGYNKQGKSYDGDDKDDKAEYKQG